MNIFADQCTFCLRVRYYSAPDNFRSDWMKDLPPDVKTETKKYRSSVCDNGKCGQNSIAAFSQADSPHGAGEDLEHVGMIVMIPRDRIRPFANQPRKYFNQQELRDLASSIEGVTQLVPISVRKITEENDSSYLYELVDGQRRWHACEIADVKRMKAIIVSVKDAQEQFTMSVISNFGRVGHGPVETAFAIKHFVDGGKSVKQTANIFAKSEPWVYKHLKLLELDQDVLNLMSPSLPEEGRLNFSKALLLVNFPPKEQRIMAKKMIINNTKMIETKAFIRAQGEKIGVIVGDPERMPNKDYNVLWSFLKNLTRDLAVHLGMPQSFFDRMLASRTDDERVKIMNSLDNSAVELKMLKYAIEKTKKE